MSIDLNDPRLPAVERLALSRERLRGALHQLTPEPSTDHEHGPSVLMTALLAIPGVSLVVDSVRSWWAQHPLHLATLVAGNTARGAMEPVARRSPFALIAVAAGIGALLFWVKPWRGLLKPALLAGLVPHLIARAMDHVPLESWMSAVSTFASERMRGAGATGPQATPAGDGATAPVSPASTASRAGVDPVAPSASSSTLH